MMHTKSAMFERHVSWKSFIVSAVFFLGSTIMYGLSIISVGPGYQFSTIQDAVDTALADYTDNEVHIEISAGIYQLTNPILIEFEDGVLVNNLTLKPMNPNDTVTLQKSGIPSTPSGFVEVRGDDIHTQSLTIDGLEFQSTGLNATNNYGIMSLGSLNSLTVMNCSFQDVYAAVSGPAGYMAQGILNLTIGNCIMSGGLIDYWSDIGVDVTLVGSVTISNNTIISEGRNPINISTIGVRHPRVLIANNFIQCIWDTNSTELSLSVVPATNQDYEELVIENNTLIDCRISVHGLAEIRENKFIRSSNYYGTSIFVEVWQSSQGYTEPTSIEYNTFWGAASNAVVFNLGSGDRPLILRNNSFLMNNRALHVRCANNQNVDLANILPDLSNNLFYVNYVAFFTSNIIPTSQAMVYNSWFNIHQPIEFGIIEDPGSCQFGDNPFVLDHTNFSYHIPWTSEYISSLIDAGIGEYDPDETPPDIGAVRAIAHDYWEYTFATQADQERWYWVSYPVLNTQTDDVLVASEFFNELLPVHENLYGDNEPTYLEQIDWMEDGDLNSVDWINSNWSENQDLHYVSSPQGYKIKLLPRTPSLVTLRESGFRTHQDTSFPLYRGENWIGYFPQDPAWPHEAFADIWEDINMIKTKNWCLVRDADWANYWGLAGKIGRLNPGDMVIVTTNQDHDFHWNTASPAPPQLPSIPEFFTFDEKQDYIPVYLSLPDSMMIDIKEIGLYLDGICKGAVVVENNVEQICAYLDLDEKLTDGVVEFVFYYNDAKSQDQECRSIRIDSARLRARYVDDNSRYSYFKVDLSPEDMQNTTSPGIRLNQNYPNPFNPSTTISFSLPEQGQVKLEIYNLRGQLVSVLADGEESAGDHRRVWDGTDTQGKSVSSGVYFYRLRTNSGTFSKRMLLMK